MIPDVAAIYLAGSLTPNVGVFTKAAWSRDESAFSVEAFKAVAATVVGDSNIVGVLMGKMSVTGADPYNTIRYNAFHTVNTPALLDPEHNRAAGDVFQFSEYENMGIVVNGKFFKTLYLAIGGLRGRY